VHVVIPQMPIGESNSPDGDDRLQLKKRKFTFDLGLLAGLPFRRLEGGSASSPPPAMPCHHFLRQASLCSVARTTLAGQGLPQHRVPTHIAS
jgi:hypothetical protein